MRIEAGVIAEVVKSGVEENIGLIVEVIRRGPPGWWVCKTMTWTRNHKHVAGQPVRKVLTPPGAITNIKEDRLVFKRKAERA